MWRRWRLRGRHAEHARALNVTAPTVSGTVTLNGAAPVDGTACTSGTYTKAYVAFTETTLGYTLEVPILCSATTYAFSAALPVGTYSVAVSGLASYTNLPTTAYVANPSLAVTAAVTSLALDVKAFSLAGMVTLNGGAPMDCPSGSFAGLTKALVTFTDPSGKIPQQQLTMSCGVPGYAFAGMILPGTYRVVVSGEASYSNLPATALVNPAYVVSAAVTSLALDVKTFTVSGKLTMNGVAPTACPAAAPPRRRRRCSRSPIRHSMSAPPSTSCAARPTSPARRRFRRGPNGSRRAIRAA